jgi:polyferredoxin
MITATDQAPEIPNQPAAAPKPEAESATRLWKISGEAVSPKRALMKSQRRLQKISARISLVILTLGFSFLGLLSFVNKPQADLATVPCVESASSIAGSAASLLAGTTFLVASCVYWRRCQIYCP